jgi:UDPglucose--hexose-1-phosphate uridylyltransferase
MPELRWNPIDEAWVVIADERGRRPNDFRPVRPAPVDRSLHPCPFCLIQEGYGPNTRLASRTIGSDRALVVANLYPALAVEAPEVRRAEGPWAMAGGVGAHEVVIESRQHDVRLKDLPDAQIASVLGLWRDRIADLEGDRRMRWVTAFRNEGPAAGASLEHPHSQILAASALPERLVRSLAATRAHHARTERCLSCDIIAHERQSGARVIADQAGFIAIAPYASRHPFELWVLPVAHAARFTSVDAAGLDALAQLLGRVLRALDDALDGVGPNMCLHHAPSARSFAAEHAPSCEDHWHWRLEILPRIQSYGGLEVSQGLHVNPTPPEEAAAHLRGLL